MQRTLLIDANCELLSARVDAASDHSMIDFRLVPFPCNRHPLIDFSLQSRMVSEQMKRVEPVDDIPHQVSHLIVADMRDFGPRDAFAIGVDHGHVAPVTGSGDRRLACMDGLEVRVAHAKHRQCFGELGGDTLFGFLVHDRSLLPRAESGQRIADGFGSIIRLHIDPRTVVGHGRPRGPIIHE